MPAIAPNQVVMLEFFLWCTQRGDFSGNVFDVKIKDQAGVMLYDAGLAVPIRQN